MVARCWLRYDEQKEESMGGESRIPGLVAVVVSVVACLPSACCLGFYAFGNFATLFVDPEMIEAAAGSQPLPPSGTFVALGGVSTLAALVALGLGIAGLVWGIRALLREPS
jgi:hypothetical protein